ncbi:COMPASS component SWD2 [Nematocida sp. AWRm77]|nr:COMPASS component SWD2 [Nematocida sp. AWRm77]
MPTFVSFSHTQTLCAQAPFSCAYSPCGEVLACALEDGSLSLQLVVEGKSFSSVSMQGSRGKETVSFMDRGLLAHTMEDSQVGCVGVLSLEKGVYVRTFIHEGAEACSVSATPQTVLSCTRSGKSLLWDMRQREALGEIPGKPGALCAYLPGNQVFALIFGEKGEMKLFDARSYTTGPYSTKSIPKAEYKSMQPSPDGVKIAMCSPGSCQILNSFSGKLLDVLDAEGTPSACFSSNGEHLLYTPNTREVSMHIAQTMKHVGTFTPRPEAESMITGLLYNPQYEQLGVMSSTGVSLHHPAE